MEKFPHWEDFLQNKKEFIKANYNKTENDINKILTIPSPEKLVQKLKDIVFIFLNKIIETGDIDKWKKAIENFLKNKNKIDLPEEYIRYILSEIEQIFYYSTLDNENNYTLFSPEKIKILAEITKTIILFYSKIRKKQTAYWIPLPSFIHPIRVSRNIKLLLEKIKNSPFEDKIFEKIWKGDNKIESTFFFLTVAGLLHDLPEDWIKQQNIPPTQNSIKETLQLFKINDTLKGYLDNDLLISVLDKLNLPWWLSFDEIFLTFINPKELNKLKKYTENISKCPICLLIKLADILDNTWWTIDTKPILKYMYNLFEYFHKEKRLLQIFKQVISIKEKNKSFPEINYSTLETLLKKLEKTLTIYNKLYKNDLFKNYTKQINEEKFKDELIHFIAFIDEKNLNQIIRILFKRIEKVYQETLTIFIRSEKLDIKNPQNFSQFQSFLNQFEKNNKLKNNELFKFILSIMTIYSIKYFSFLDNIKHITQFKKTNNTACFNINLKWIEEKLKIEKENEDTIKNFINIVLNKLELSEDYGIRHIKARIKSATSIIKKILREPERIKEISQHGILKDQLWIAVIFYNIEEANQFAEKLSKLPKLQSVDNVNKYINQIILLEPPADRWLLNYTSFIDEDTTIFLPFTNFKLGYVTPTWKIIPFEISVRPSSIKLIKERITNFSFKTKKSELILKKEYIHEIASLILNVYEPIEHLLYRSTQDFFMIIKIQEIFFKDKQNIFNLHDYNIFKNLLNSLIYNTSKEILNLLNEKKEYLSKTLSIQENKTLNLTPILNIKIINHLTKKLITSRLIEKMCKRQNKINKKIVSNFKKWLQENWKEFDC